MNVWKRLAGIFGKQKPARGEKIRTLPYTLNLPPVFSDMRDIGSLELSADNVRARFLSARAELPEEVTVFAPVEKGDFPASEEAPVFVDAAAPAGGDGSKTAPFSDPADALAAMAGRAGGRISFAPGLYTLTESLRIGQEHSGRADRPLILRGEGDVVFTSNRCFDGPFHPIDPENDPTAARIPAAAQPHVVYTTLEEQGLSAEDMAEMKKSGTPPRLRVGEEEYSLAHFPNNTQNIHERLYFTVALDQGSCTTRDGSDLYWPWVERANKEFGGDIHHEVGWQIRLPNRLDNADDPRADALTAEVISWVNTGDIWYFGSTFEGWEFDYYNLAVEADGIRNWHYGPQGEKLLGGFTPDPEGPIYTVYDEDGNPHEENGYFFLKSRHPSKWGCKHSGNSPAGHNTFYLFNVIEALDSPGEWFYDKETGRIYLYPTESFGKNRIFYFGNSEFDLFTLEETENVIFENIGINGSGANGVFARDSSSLLFRSCRMRNTSLAAVRLLDCDHSALLFCDFSYASKGPMVVLSGPKALASLHPADNLVQNCVFHDAAPNHPFCLSFGGCRTVVSHNFFHNCVIEGSGVTTECIVEYNRFDGGSADVSDGGMIYCSGPMARGNHYRYNLCHRFRATHNGVYNDTMNSGNYAYGNIISTIGSKSNSNKGWYSSTGTGNVCYGNIFALRNPVQVAAANGRDGDEGETLRNRIGDQVNQSPLFYYYWDDKGYSQVNNPLHEITDYDGNKTGASFYQSLAAHWWRGIREKELTTYTTLYNAEAYRRRFPVYMNRLEVLKMLFAAQDAGDYAVRYFYAPIRPSGKSFSYDGLRPGTLITIPPYDYLNEAGEPVTVPQHTIESADGSATLTYEELASIERSFRAPSCCVIERNILLGGTPAFSENGRILEKSDEDKTLTDDTLRYHYLGYADTASKKKNYFHYAYQEVLDADHCRYAISDMRYSVMDHEMGKGYRDNFTKLSSEKAGLTLPFDYDSFGQ